MARQTLQIKDLVAGETYAIQVRAMGDNDNLATSPWSLTLTAALNEDVTAPGLVQGLTLVATGPAFRATWTQPTQDGDGGALNDLKDYMVVWSQTSNSGNNYTQYTENFSATLTFEENQQELGTVGDITVEVYARDHANNVTLTPPSAAVTNIEVGSFTGMTAAPDETGGTAIAVEWNQPTGSLPDGSDNGNDISYYEIYRNAKKIEDVAFSPGPMRYMDPDPRPGTHTYRVDAVDVYGNSKASNTDTATPSYLTGVDTVPPNPPAFPGGVSSDFLTGGAVAESRTGQDAYIDVTFDAPTQSTDTSDYEDNEGFLIKWNVQGSPDVFDRFAVDTRENPQTDPVETTVRINGLRTGVTYDVQVAAFDTSRNFSTFISGSETTPSDTTAPGQPSAPSASNDVQSVLVSHDLTLQAGGNLPVDVIELKIYAATVSGFTPGAGNQIGVVPVVPGVPPVEKYPLPSGEATPAEQDVPTWYFKVVAVDAAGNESAASPETTSTPDLIAGANILNATIDDAKINELSANKIVAGTGIIKDLTITTGGSFTVDASGYMQSSNWDGTTAGNNSTLGWWMGQSGLVINDGTIQAATLTTIDANMVPYDYAAMPSYERWYKENVWTTGSVFPNPEIGTEGGVWFRYGYQSLAWSPDTGSDDMFFGTSATDYNINAEPSSDYVFSVYVYNNSGGSRTVYPQVKDDQGVTTLGDPFVIASGGVQRVSMGYTTGSLVGAVTVGLRNGTTAAAFLIDGVQFERVSAGSAPSFFTMPGGTTITGNTITTGQIESSNYADANGNPTGNGWQIDLSGDVEFRNGLFRGTIQATAGQIENDLSVNGKLIVDRTDSTDDIWIGNDIVPGDTATWVGVNFESNLTDTTGTNSNNIWAIKDTGQVVFRVGDASNYMRYNSATNDLQISGELVAATGNFTGTITATGGQITGPLSVSSILSAGDTKIGQNLGGSTNRDGILVDNSTLNSWWTQGTRKYFRAGQSSAGTYILYDSNRTSNPILLKGNVEMQGTFSSSATINGGTLNAGMVRTSSSGNRVQITEVSGDGHVDFYDASGNKEAQLYFDDSANRFWLDASTHLAADLYLRGDGVTIDGYLSYVSILSSFDITLSVGGAFVIENNSGANMFRVSGAAGSTRLFDFEVDNAQDCYLRFNGDEYIFWDDSLNEYKFSADGAYSKSILLAGQYAVSSDIKYKENVSGKTNRQESVMSIKPREYTVASSKPEVNDNRVGLVAQELQEAFGVNWPGVKQPAKDNPDDGLAIDYAQVIVELIEVIQDLVYTLEVNGIQLENYDSVARAARAAQSG